MSSNYNLPARETAQESRAGPLGTCPHFHTPTALRRLVTSPLEFQQSRRGSHKRARVHATGYKFGVLPLSSMSADDWATPRNRFERIGRCRQSVRMGPRVDLARHNPNYAAGRNSLNTVPCRAGWVLLLTRSQPLCCRITSFTTGRPIPCPPDLVVKDRSNNCGSRPESIPVPLSAIVTRTPRLS